MNYSCDKSSMIVTNIATYTIVVALKAALVIDMIAGNTITSQLFVTTKAKTTMPNTKTDLDQGHNHNQGPILVIPEA